jgi:hypothetical protein
MATKPAESSMKSRKNSNRVKLELMLSPEVKAEFDNLAQVTGLTKVALFGEMLKRWSAEPVNVEQEKQSEESVEQENLLEDNVEQEKLLEDSAVFADARRLLFAYGALPAMARRALQKEVDAETGEYESWKVSGSEAAIRYNRINNALISLGFELEQDDDVPEFLRLNGIQSDDLSINMINTQMNGKPASKELPKTSLRAVKEKASAPAVKKKAEVPARIETIKAPEKTRKQAAKRDK